MILDYLLQIEIFLYMLEVQISVSIWRKKGQIESFSICYYRYGFLGVC